MSSIETVGWLVAPVYATLAVEALLAYRCPEWLARGAFVEVPLGEAGRLALPESVGTREQGYRGNARQELQLEEVVGELSLTGSNVHGSWNGRRGLVRTGSPLSFAWMIFTVVAIEASAASRGAVVLRARAWPVGTASLVAALPYLVWYFTLLAEWPPVVVAVNVAFFVFSGVLLRRRLRGDLARAIDGALASLRGALAKARERAASAELDEREARDPG